MKNIAIFASGSGSNAENIISYFNQKKSAKVALILCNNSKAFVIERAKRLHVDCLLFTKSELSDSNKIADLLQTYSIDYIVLAGFMLFMPDSITRHYQGRIINIHPSLLPKFGGKGMYGDKVHQAVIAAGETKSGITIHHVNNKFDDGTPIFTADVIITPEETPETLAEKIHELERQHFPRIIEEQINLF